MANKTINELSPVTLSSTSEFAVYQNGSTGKATLQNILGSEDFLYAYDDDEPTGEVEFESADTTLTPSSSVSVDLLTGNDSWGQRFAKVSQMFKNIRYLLSKLGTTDISSIGNGTVTGAISTLNNKKLMKEPLIIVAGSSNYTIQKGFAFKIGDVAYIALQMSSTTQITAGSSPLFRLDYTNGHSISPDIANNGSQSGNTVTWPLYLIYGTTATATSTGVINGHVYFTSLSTIPANTTIYITGSFACHNQN